MKKLIIIFMAAIGMAGIQAPAASAADEIVLSFEYHTPCRLNTVNWQARGCGDANDGKVYVVWPSPYCVSPAGIWLDVNIYETNRADDEAIPRYVVSRVGQYLLNQYGPLPNAHVEITKFTSARVEGYYYTGVSYCPGRTPVGGVYPGGTSGGGVIGSGGGGGIIGGGGGIIGGGNIVR